MVPLAGNRNAFGISITMSGLIFQPSGKVIGARLVLGVAFGRAVVGPRGHDVDLFGAQAAVIGEVAVLADRRTTAASSA